MFSTIDKIFRAFNPCFSREDTFSWFCIIVFGLITRNDTYGITSIIRSTGIDPNCYVSMLHFFRVNSHNLEMIQYYWSKIVLTYCQPVKIDNRILLLGDGIKISKEAHRMPVVKKLHQDSDNSAKPSYIWGHHFGVIGMVVGNLNKHFCLSLTAEIQEGVAAIRTLQGKENPIIDGKEEVTISSLMAFMATKIAKNLASPCLLVVDAYYPGATFFSLIKTVVDDYGNRLMHIVSRAKSSYVGFKEPPPKLPGTRGRKAIYGAKVQLSSQFSSNDALWEKVTVTTYGKTKTVSVRCMDLIWKPVKEMIRFVLVKDGNRKFILMSSDLTLSPALIIEAYGQRFKIEVNFNVMKNIIGVFDYHFWTKLLPKLNHKQDTDISEITEVQSQKLIAQATNAIEFFVNLGCIATGILQILALNKPVTIWQQYHGWLRTIKSTIPTEAVVRVVLQDACFRKSDVFRNSDIHTKIVSKEEGSRAKKKTSIA